MLVLILHSPGAFAQKSSFHKPLPMRRLGKSCVSENGFPVVPGGASSWPRFNYHSTKNVISGEKLHPTSLLSSGLGLKNANKEDSV